MDRCLYACRAVCSTLGDAPVTGVLLRWEEEFGRVHLAPRVAGRREYGVFTLLDGDRACGGRGAKRSAEGLRRPLSL